MRLSPRFAPLSVLLLTPSLDAQAVYERDGDGWVRIEAAGRFAVDPHVVTVRFAPGVGDLAGFLERLGAAAGELADLELVRVNALGIHDLAVPAGTDVLAIRDQLRATGLVRYAEENTVGRYIGIPNDPDFGDQDNLMNTAQSGGVFDADVDAELAWDVTTGDPDVIVAVLDSGTELDHEDLAANIWANPGEIPGNGIDDDSNGFIDDVAGWNFDFGTNDPTGSFFHGTFVAGVVGAHTNNGIGLAGIAGGWGPDPGCSLMIANVGSSFPMGDILDDAILYAADNGADVIQMSLTVGTSSAIEDACDYAKNVRGVFIDCAAGNGFGGPVGFPANDPNVYAIGGTTDDDVYVSFASQGPEVWVTAQADDVTSLNLNDGYTVSDGTSFSAPLVAGTAGLIRSILPNSSPDDVAEILKVTAKDIGAVGFDNQSGWGRINAHQAVLHAEASDCNNNGIYDPSELDVNGNGIPDSCEEFSESVSEISVSLGTTVDFTLDSPNFFAGDTYLIAGSASGTSPGIDFGPSGVLPLNPDVYFVFSVANANGATFVDTFGTLDGSGNATASLVVGPGQKPGLIGMTFHHAYVVANGFGIVRTSNSVPVLFIP